MDDKGSVHDKVGCTKLLSPPNEMDEFIHFISIGSDSDCN